jgi:hypothetical protein
MHEVRENSQLKVCCTCGYWSYQHKGFCQRLEQGAGKFWVCEDWSATAAAAGEPHLEPALVGGTAG